MIKAVAFDLDDTLFAETDYVKSGFNSIGTAFGDKSLADKLWKLFCEDKKNVYQRAGFSEKECQRCIEIYREHFPDITLSKDIKETLYELKSKGLKLGIITDGRPEGQRNKIAALGLDEIMDCIIVTDELGGEEFRKPHPRSFELMREFLGIDFCEMMYVGDNPKKDFFIGSIYPIVTVRLYGNGIYDREEYVGEVKEKKKITAIAELLEEA